MLTDAKCISSDWSSIEESPDLAVGNVGLPTLNSTGAILGAENPSLEFVAYPFTDCRLFNLSTKVLANSIYDLFRQHSRRKESICVGYEDKV